MTTSTTPNNFTPLAGGTSRAVSEAGEGVSFLESLTPLSIIGKYCAGAKVFPCWPDKTPHTDHGFKDASNDPSQITAWWNEHPEDLVGFATGGGYAVLDIDCKKGKDGFTELKKLEAVHGKLPPTFTVKTMSGGEHRYYRYEPFVHTLKSSADKLAIGVDVRASGGYVIVPPSVGYTVVEDVPVAPLPAAWIDLIEVKKTMTTTTEAHGDDTDMARECLKHISANCSRDMWIEVGMAMKSAGLSYSEFDAWSRGGGEKYSGESDTFKVWQSFTGDGVSIATLVFYAKQNGFRPQRETTITHSGGMAGANGSQLILDPKDHYGTARKFAHDSYAVGSVLGLLHHDNDFRRYTGTHYAVHDAAAVRADLWQYQERAQVEIIKRDKIGEIVNRFTSPYRPNTNSVNNALDALKALTNLPREIMPPAWLTGTGIDPAELLAFNNVIVHLPTGNTLPHDPRLFITHCRPFDYNPKATCSEWLKFLNQLWPTDQQAIETLMLIFGYLIGGGTYLHKIFALIGPPRSGKGSIARILAEIMGSDACCGPTLAGLATPFGLQTLIGKQLATIADARLSGRADQSQVVERLLTISGEDQITIQRKYSTDWTGTLPTRFLMLSNELPRLADSSGALANRFVMLTLAVSFLGREDHALQGRLMQELPGIANWAIEGWKLLQERGRIESPESSRESIEELCDLGSPVSAFVRDCCRIGNGYEAERGALYQAWCSWCEAEGRNHPGTTESFGRDLRAAVPSLRTVNRRVCDTRKRFYEGIGIGSGGVEQVEHVPNHCCLENENHQKEEKKSVSNNRKSPVPPVPPVPAAGAVYASPDLLATLDDPDDDLPMDEGHTLIES